MSASGEGVTDAGQNGLLGSVENEPDAMAIFARHLNERLVSLQEKLTPAAEIQMALFKDEDRRKLVEEFVSSLAPNGVSPAVWLRWLNGGPGPFASGAIKKPAALSQGLGKTIARGPASLKTQRDKVERARADLALAERELEYGEALNKGLLQYAVTDHVVELLSPVFAMGPAWTIMRSMSGHLPKEVAENETAYFVGSDRDDAQAAMRVARVEESKAMMNTLDLFSGHIAFEEALRSVVSKVCKDFEKLRDEVALEGRRPRSKERMRSEVHPKAQDDAEDILKGLAAACL